MMKKLFTVNNSIIIIIKFLCNIHLTIYHVIIYYNNNNHNWNNIIMMIINIMWNNAAALVIKGEKKELMW